MAYFPFFIELSGRDGLVVGGGAVAVRKIRTLLPFGPRLTAAAEEFSPELREIPGLTLRQGPFDPALLAGRFFVVAATDDRDLNRRIADLCREDGILVNAVDDREACGFLFPALLRRGSLTMGVSTGGASPTGAAWVRDRAAEVVPPAFDEILSFLEARRPRVLRALREEGDRSECLAALFRRCLESGGALSEEEFAGILASFGGGEES